MSTTSITPPPAAAQDAGARQPRPAAMRWALARVEGRRLLMHPLFMLAMVGAAILALGSGNGWKANVGGGADLMDLAGWGFVPASPVIFLVACLAASRARRDAAQDFHRPQPLAPRLRTQAALLSLGWAGLAAAALTAVATVAIAGSDLLLVVDAGRYRLQPWELAQGPLYVVTIAAFGVLAGTWTSHAYPAVIGALILFLPPAPWLSWIVLGDGVPAAFDVSQAGASVGWHLVGLTGLAVLAAAGALARHDRRARIALLAVAGLGATIAGLALGLPPGGVLT